MSAHSTMPEAVENLSASVSRLAQSASSYAQAKLNDAGELIQTETRRRMTVLFSACALLLWFSTALLFAGVAIVTAFWESHRVLASSAVAGGFLILAAIAAWVMADKMRQHPTTLDWIARLIALFARSR